ncbi:MAG: hypothetical protein DSY47_04040 [Hydrogenothermus sp.]|nr:MAG: hypothetical protein DSY47_04040 [Hydrogenothermus sp.]
MSNSIVFLQIPIIDKNENIFGYRIKLINEEEISEKDFLTFLENFYIKKPTFIKLSPNLLSTPEILQFLDKEKVIIITEEGFVEDFKIATYLNSPNISIADYLILRSIEEIEKALSIPAVKILENVKSLDDFEKLKSKDIDLFEGYFFLEKKEFDESKVKPSKLAILNIFNSVVNDFSIDKIEEELKRNPDISIELLRFINSAAFGLRREIKSIRHAISLLGQRQFLNWLLLSIYLADEENKKQTLFETAAIRGKMLELLSQKLNLDKEKVDKGFLVGILSIIGLIMEKPKKEILEEINVDDEIKKAILEYKGIHGKLLKALEYLEQEMLDKVDDILKELHLSIEDLMQAQLNAIIWFNNLQAE